MTTANRFGAFLCLLPLINIDKRPKIVTRVAGNLMEQVIPLALFEDLRESMFMMEYADGVRPYVLEWYYDVFLKAFKEKHEPESKIIVNSKGGEVEVTERIIALITEELVKKTEEVYKRTIKLICRRIKLN
jgi:hypothetical protein